MKKWLAFSLFAFSLTGFTQTFISPLENFEPTNIENMSQAKSIFKTMKTDTKTRGQCYNRAHAWSYDLYLAGINSKKILIYYTNKFRKELDNKWGFHIAPMLVVDGEDMVFDREFLKEPVSQNQWQDHFIHYGQTKLEYKRKELIAKKEKLQKSLNSVPRSHFNYYAKVTSIKDKIAKLEEEMRYLNVTENKPAKITCKVIENITNWDEGHQEEWCYLQQVSMYYWTVPDLRNLDSNNQVKNQFVIDEIDTARKEAFNNYKKLWDKEYSKRKFEEELERSRRRGR
jgi:hypothetical protein